MLDMDYKNESKDYILDIYFGIEADGLYIGVQYKDGTLNKVPFNIHNYNAITSRLERQYNKYISSFLSYKIKKLGFETLKIFIDLLCFLAINVFCFGDNMLFNCCFFIISGLIFLITTIKRESKFLSLNNKERNNAVNIVKYLANKEKFLIELPDGDSFYGVNIANIDSKERDSSSIKFMQNEEIEYKQNEEIKGQIKALMLSYEKENSKDGING